MTIKYVLPRWWPYAMVAAFPGIILVRRGYIPSAIAIRHEQIHHEQQKEMLVVFFYIWYVLEFIVRLLQKGTWHKAYRRIAFEQEAYNEAGRPISQRPAWRWVKYL